MPLQVLSHTGGIANTNCHLLIDDDSQQAVLFDAPDHTVEPLLIEIKRRKLALVGLWLTHGHFDHLADHAVVRKAFPDARVLIHRLDEHKLTQPGSKVFQLPFVIPPGKADQLLEDGDTLDFAGHEVRVLHTPGHSPGHVCFHLPSEQLLIGGDLIIGGAVGRYDLPDASLADLQNSVRKIMQLDPDTTLLPGHGEPSTLAEELVTNAYVRRIVS